MRTVFLVALLVACTAGVTAQRRGAGSAGATLAITVTDPAGTPIPEVEVTLTGPATRTATTEGGRIALEGLRAGTYLLRFEREGFVTLEREVAARAGKPIEIKVALKPLPAPPPPEQPEPAPVDAKPMFADLPALIETEFVGRAPSRTTALACGAEANATLIQLNEPLAQHAHDTAGEVFYVVAGEGNARIGTGQQRLKAGMFLFVPQGMPHALIPSGRNPLIVLSVRAGEGCR